MKRMKKKNIKQTKKPIYNKYTEIAGMFSIGMVYAICFLAMLLYWFKLDLFSLLFTVVLTIVITKLYFGR